jgi:hypothetical protein
METLLTLTSLNLDDSASSNKDDTKNEISYSTTKLNSASKDESNDASSNKVPKGFNL